PGGGFLTSTDGIPANVSQTMSQNGDPPLSDGAPPVLVSTTALDSDGNGAVDRVTFTFSEPVGFTPAQGYSLSGYLPVTDTALLGTTTKLYLSIAGESTVTITLTGAGPQPTGGDIARRIEDAVHLLMKQPVSVTGHDPLKRPAYLNFTCSFTSTG